MKRLIHFAVISCLCPALAVPAFALDILGRDASEGGQGTSRGLVALYLFSASRNGTPLEENTIADESGVGTPLDLRISNTNAIQRKCDRSFFDPVTNRTVPVCYLDFVEGSSQIVRSIAPATKIASQCKSTNELTVEMWVRNDRADELSKEGRMMPLKILTMGRNTATTVNNKYIGSSNDNNFYVGIDYNMAPQFTASLRYGPRQQRDAEVNDGFTSANNNFNMQQASRYAIETSRITLNTPDSPEQKILVNNQLQQLVFTFNASGEARLYVSAATEGAEGVENPFALVPVLRTPPTRSPANVAQAFAGWGDNFYLGIGNELTYNDQNAPVVRTGGNATFRTENREWRGEIYLMAIYCNAHSEQEILGDLAPDANFKSYPPNPSVPITPELMEAARLYTRLVGVKIPITAPIISGVNDPRVPDEDYQGRGMVQMIQQGNWLGAAQLATTQDGFYNITIRDFAKRMSTRDETVNTALNDMVATIIGVARDNLPATQILTGNFFYMGDSARTAAPSNIHTDILLSNNHYERLEALNYNLRQVLKRVDGQKISNGASAVDHPDPAGVLTSRAFLGAHAVAGTNRRVIEYAFREFLCSPMTSWMDSSGPDNRIGRDVDRYPGGDHTKFLTSCRGCHSNMDGFRGAFARFHFNNNFVKHTSVVTASAPTEDDETPTTMCQRPQGIACKMNRNDDVFDRGYWTVDDSWINNATRGSNAINFGWTESTEGRGARSFGQLLAGSKAFPNCMAKRAFRAVCKRDPGPLDASMIERVATEFVNDNYNLRNLFARVAITRECMGVESGQ